jgi:hypothetical protein
MTPQTTAALVANRGKDKPRPRPRTLTILYNGNERVFRYCPQQPLSELLAEAIAAFGIATNQHLLSLFDVAGNELPECSTLHEDDVRAGAELILRPSRVKGG